MDRNFEEKLDELSKKVSSIELDNEQLKSENQNLNSKAASAQTERENLESTINSLKKKIQSLVQENAKINTDKLATPPPTSSNIWSFPMSPLFKRPQNEDENENGNENKDKKEEFNIGVKEIKEESVNGESLHNNEKVLALEEEIKQLKERNSLLYSTIET